jgi:hypothetical protein
MELKILFHTFAFIPVALINAYSLSGMNGSPIVGKIIWRIRKNHVDTVGWQ